MATPLTTYNRTPPPADPNSAPFHLDGELKKLEISTASTNAIVADLPNVYAKIDSPTLTGDPQAPTPATGDNSTSIATTGFVKAQSYITGVSVALTGDVTGSASGTSLSLAATIAAGVVTFAKMATAAVATAAEYAAGTASKLLSASNVWAAAAFVTLTDGATITPDFNAGWNFKVTIAGNRTLANPTNLKEGQTGTIRINQDGTGGRTLAYGTSWKFPNSTAPVLDTTAGSTNILSYQVLSATEVFAVLNKKVG